MTEDGDEQGVESPVAADQTDMPIQEPIDDLLQPIPLPEVRTSVRAQRRTQKQGKRGRGVAVAGLAVLVALTALIVADNRPPKSGSNKGKSSALGVVVDRHAVLFALAGADGRAATMTLLVPPDKGSPGTVLLIPAGTLTEMSGLGPQPIGRALAVGGESLLKSTTENLLGAKIEFITVLDPDTLATTLEPFGSLRINVPEQVERVADDGLVTVLFRAGPINLKPEQAADYLSSPGSGSDLKRLARHQTFWEAVLGAVKTKPTNASTAPEALADVLVAMANGSFQVRLLPVQSFGTTPTDGELYQANEADIRRTVDQSMGASSGSRTRVRILNGTGTLELARRVEERLVPADIQVTLTGNADRLNYEETQIIYHDLADRPAAFRVQQALGVGTLIHNRNQTNVVDVTVVVGKDFEAE